MTETDLSTGGRYVHSGGDANWWIPSGLLFYSPDDEDTSGQELSYAREHFFMPHRFRDPFGQTTAVLYDRYDLFVTETTDAIGNMVEARNDYRAMQPSLVTDQNGNRAAVIFDALGLVAGTAIMGKAEENEGDSLEGLMADLSDPDLDDFFADPRGRAASLLANATTRIIYDLDRFRTTGQPAYAATLARETHVSDLPPDAQSEVRVSISYSDGFGREIQKKAQAEPGPVVEGGPTVDLRWVGSGWTIFNNKGKPVKQYEPFFAATHEFEFNRRQGVSPTLFYDPLGRVVATLHPNHTYEKVVFDPWRQETWDVNDTVLQSDPKNDPQAGDFFRRLETGWW